MDARYLARGGTSEEEAAMIINFFTSLFGTRSLPIETSKVTDHRELEFELVRMISAIHLVLYIAY